jgi:hypothetical protein
MQRVLLGHGIAILTGGVVDDAEEIEQVTEETQLEGQHQTPISNDKVRKSCLAVLEASPDWKIIN